MGEARRRREQDPDYGKPLITAAALYTALCERYGLGVMVWWPGLPATYHLPGSPHLNETDQVFFQHCNPEQEAIVSWPVGRDVFLTTSTQLEELTQHRYNARSIERALPTVLIFPESQP